MWACACVCVCVCVSCLCVRVPVLKIRGKEIVEGDVGACAIVRGVNHCMYIVHCAHTIESVVVCQSHRLNFTGLTNTFIQSRHADTTGAQNRAARLGAALYCRGCCCY